MKNFTRRFTPLKIAIFYACIGGLWVAVNVATIVANIALERNILHAIEVSSASFVLISAWMLYFIISKSRKEAIYGAEPLNRLIRALKAYTECNKVIIRVTDEKQLMNDICRIFIDVGGYRMAWVGTAANDAEKTITPAAGWGEDYEFVEIFKNTCMNSDMGQGPIKTALKTGKPVVLQNMHKNPIHEQCRIRIQKHGFCSAIFLPLSSHNETFAALMIYSSGKNVFDEEEVSLLTELSNDLSHAISSLRLAAEKEKIEQHNQLLATVIVQMRAGLFLVDSHEVIQYVNPAAEKITGIPALHLIGNNIHKLSYEEHDGNFYRALLSEVSQNKPHSADFQHKRQDGAILELELTTWPVKDHDNSIISHVGMLRDITHEMQLENQLRQAQRMEAIGILAGGIAHDFNNALASIITCTEMALDEAADGSTLWELLDVVLRSGLRGKDLVRQILTFSRQTEQDRQEVQVDLIVKECLKLLRSTLSPSIEICLHIEENLGLVFADPTQMHQVVMNLCTNAVHAIREQGHGVIELKLKNCDLDGEAASHFANLDPGNYLQLSVRDNGHGMDKLTMQRIFDPFFSTKSHGEGTGLGLSVIHGIITKLNGTITVNSTPGHGSLFDIYLPRINKGNEIVQDKLQVEKTKSGSERILLVDDDVNLVFSTKLMLQHLGYNVVSRTDPRQALELFSSDPSQFDLVITDQAMPQMSGMELAFQLSRIRPGIPIVLCTGHDPSAVYGTDETGQIADYISELAIKPLERHELAETLRRVFDNLVKEGTSIG